MNTPDTEITLTRGLMRLHVSPYGASLRGLTRSGQPVVTGYTGASGKVGGQGDVLIPFPGRVKGGRYAFGGQTFQMDINDKEGPNAIHGFLRGVLWDVAKQDDTSVTFQADMAADAHKGYPFALRAQVTWQVTDQGLACRFSVQNTGDASAPVAAGFHPYFTVGPDFIDTSTLQVPFASYLEYDDALLPTGNVLPVDGSPLDFRRAHPIGPAVFNTCYAGAQPDADGKTRIVLQNADASRAVTVTLGAAMQYVVLYSGDPLPPSHSRRALAIEPMTCGSDGFNHPAWGLAVLAPGAFLSGEWQVEARG